MSWPFTMPFTIHEDEYSAENEENIAIIQRLLVIADIQNTNRITEGVPQDDWGIAIGREDERIALEVKRFLDQLNADERQRFFQFFLEEHKLMSMICASSFINPNQVNGADWTRYIFTFIRISWLMYQYMDDHPELSLSSNRPKL